MNRKQFILVLLALALVGSAGLVLAHRHQQAWSMREAKAGSKVLPNFRFNNVAAIHIQGRADFNLVRKHDSWCLPERGDYPANYNQIKDLLIKVRDLKVVQSETVGPSQLGRVGLEEPGKGPGSGLLLEFKDEQSKPLGALLLGQKHDRQQNENEPIGLHGFFDGRYLLVPSDPHSVLLVPDELAAAAAEPGAWLSPDFFKVENIKFISLLSPNPTNSWELSRETDSAPWTLTGLNAGESLNTGAAADVAEILAFPRFADVLPPNTPAAVLGRPSVVTVLSDSLAYTLKVGAKRPDGLYPLMVSVTGALPEERIAGKEETPELKQKLDQEYPEKKKQLQAKLAREQALSHWVYLVDSWIEMVVRERAQLVKPASAAPSQSAQR